MLSKQPRSQDRHFGDTTIRPTAAVALLRLLAGLLTLLLLQPLSQKLNPLLLLLLNTHLKCKKLKSV